MNEAAYTDYSFDLTEHNKIYFKDTHKPYKTVNGIKVYRCTLCKQYKPKSEYYRDKRNPCGIRNKCKRCYHKKTIVIKN